MPRKQIIRTDEFPYHVTSRANHRHWFSLEMNEVWKISCEALIIANRKHPVIIQAYVLMGNHYHLLLKTPNANIDHFMYEFNKNFSLGLRQKTQLINRMFGGRYKWTLINQKRYFLNVIKYIYRNPVKAKIVNQVQGYPYSTINYHHELDQNLNIERIEGDAFYHENFVNWLNEEPSIEDDNKIGNGLKRTSFNLGRDKDTKRPRMICDRYEN